MSTKIYYGVRFPKTRLGEFVEHVTREGRAQVVNAARSWIERFDEDSEGFKEAQAERPRASPELIKVRKVIAMIREAAQSLDRAPWIDVECGWRVWLTPGRFALALPWGERITKIELPEWVESYGYWDNVDRPDDVSAAEWRRRRVAWAPACEPWSTNYDLKIEVFKVDRTISGGIGVVWLEHLLIREARERDKAREGK